MYEELKDSKKNGETSSTQRSGESSRNSKNGAQTSQASKKRTKNEKNSNNSATKSSEQTRAKVKDKNKESYQLMSVNNVAASLEVNISTGLTKKEASSRLERDGRNCFTPPPDKAWYWLFLREMTGGFAILMWLAAIGSFVIFATTTNPQDNPTQDAYLGGILVFTIVVTGTFSYYQQASSSKVFKSFKNLAPSAALVLRTGKKQSVSADEIVVGDIVYVQAGDRIPADIRVIQSDNFKVDNSSITGESEPLLRTTDIALENNALEAANLAFFSTNCTEGSGVGIVIATGDRTVMGDIASIVTNIEQGQTPIGKEISRFVKIITVLTVISGLVFGGVYYYFGTTIANSFLFMIGITVGNVPEGLLPALTVALTLTAKRMASKNCMVKLLEAVETLGSTSTICSDKTGTLTQNRMTVEHCWFGDRIYLFRDRQLTSPDQDASEVILRLDWLALKRCAMLCSRAEFLEQEQTCDVEDMPCSGDASEQGIMKFLQLLGPDSVAEYRAVYPKLAEKPFNSTDKHQFSIHSFTNAVTGEFGGHFLVMKGAPERILTLCSSYLNDRGQTQAKDDTFLEHFERAYHAFGSEGERVLAFCDLDLDPELFPEGHEFPSSNLSEHIKLENLRFLGLVSLTDPPKEGVANAVKLCRSAGIRVVMVTGDHPITAQAIAKQVNIVSSSHQRQTSIASLRSTVSDSGGQRSIVIPGDELADMEESRLQEILMLYGEIVFARTSPKQKLRIVSAFQSLDEIVAVTGDGVNDSPALKRADIGVAMGISGSEVSKQAADMILLDDNFSTIVTGIEEGRRIFDNMKKTVSYILAGNVTTIYPFILFAALGLPLSITTITALMISLGTDIFPAVSLSYEKAEGDIMHIKPRDPKNDRLVNFRLLFRAYLIIGIVGTITAYVAYFQTMYERGYTPKMLYNSRVHWYNETYIMERFESPTNHTPVPSTYDHRAMTLREAQSAYFCGIVVTQWIDVIVCKTRRVSVFQHGFGNWYLNLAIVLETAMTAAAMYVPAVAGVLGTAPVSWRAIAYTLPIIPILLLLEETRKAIIRAWPKSKVAYALLA